MDFLCSIIYYQNDKQKQKKQKIIINPIKKIKKGNYADNGNRKKKEHMGNYYSKRKKLLNHLINCVKNLEKLSLNKYFFKYYESFLNP